MTLPEAFLDDIRPYLPDSELTEFIAALSADEASCSIRFNPRKAEVDAALEAVPWCTQGRYLPRRPNFTLDPRMHAGAYYVQEASSMFVAHVVRWLVGESTTPLVALDLCAAPGGKSTAALSALPEGSLLVSNEIDRRRARILAENLTKWGSPYDIVTANAPRDFEPLRHTFDLIIADVPCSGEGMFRKDEGAVSDWSPQKVRDCASLQREILDAIWGCLKPGGYLIYSTCTFNVHEDEEQLAYLCDTLGATAMDITTPPEWHIHPPLTGDLPCYRFMPHRTVGEGLFMCAVRKPEDAVDILPAERRHDYPAARPRSGKGDRDGKGRHGEAPRGKADKGLADLLRQAQRWVNLPCSVVSAGDAYRAIPDALRPLYDRVIDAGLYVLQAGVNLGEAKGRDLIPAHGLALSTARLADAFPQVELPLETALRYLRREAIVLPEEAPLGYVIVCHQGLALGFVKNMGNRCNSLYPQEWRIRYC